MRKANQDVIRREYMDDTSRAIRRIVNPIINGLGVMNMDRLNVRSELEIIHIIM